MIVFVEEKVKYCKKEIVWVMDFYNDSIMIKSGIMRFKVGKEISVEIVLEIKEKYNEMGFFSGSLLIKEIKVFIEGYLYNMMVVDVFLNKMIRVFEWNVDVKYVILMKNLGCMEGL